MKNVRARKIDKVKMTGLLNKGKSQSEIAQYFGVSEAAVSKMRKSMSKITTGAVIAHEAPQVISNTINANQQLEKINKTMNSLLDLLVKAQNGDDDAIVKLAQTLELNGKGGFDVPSLIIKTCAELRHGLDLQRKIYETLFQIEAAQQFMTEALDVISSIDPEARNEIIRRLNAKNALRASFQTE